jgi:hypothetical protein
MRNGEVAFAQCVPATDDTQPSSLRVSGDQRHSLSARSVASEAGRSLFQSRFRSENFPYAVMSDGRFLVNRSVDVETPSGITLVVNWPATLRKG